MNTTYDYAALHLPTTFFELRRTRPETKIQRRARRSLGEVWGHKTLIKAD